MGRLGSSTCLPLTPEVAVLVLTEHRVAAAEEDPGKIWLSLAPTEIWSNSTKISGNILYLQQCA